VRVPLRFRGKIFLALALLACGCLAAALVAVRDVATRRARDDASERFARAQEAFSRLQSLRMRHVAEAVGSLAATNSQFRTVLSTASIGANDLGFGSASDPAASLADANLRLRSLVPSLSLVQGSDVFVVTSAGGALLYSRADPERVGVDLSALPVLREAKGGDDAVTIWSRAEDLPAGVAVVPRPPPDAVYEVVAEPVAFGDELHGVVLVGQRLDRAMLEEVREISGLDVALASPGAAPISTLRAGAAADLAARLASTPNALESAGAVRPGGRFEEWRLGGHRFLVGRAEIVPLASVAPHFLLFASLDPTLAFLRAVENTILVVGIGVLAAAVAAAFALARGITRPVSTLARAVARVGHGELDTEVTIQSGDELEELGGAFNEMVAGLRERDRIRHTFERHVSKSVAEEILRHPEAVARAGERREVSVLFVDLGGFTAHAERSAPEAVLARLNEYFEAVCDAVFAYEGTVNELLGDGMLTFFGAPIRQPDHARRACLAALRCRASLEALTATWRAQGLADLRFRIGVHTGPVVVGEMGTSARGKYGAIGDTVNLASRIEGVNRHYGTGLLVSEATRDAAGDAVAFREIDAVQVVGRAKAVRLFEPLGPPDDVTDARRAAAAGYAAALARYRAGDFAAAEAGFAALVAAHPGDPAAQALLVRTRLLRSSPPATWDGVHRLAEK
jgi:class 3 adenylate cyclase